MKIYMSVDLEGATGVCSREQTIPGDRRYPESQALLLSDVNAAVQGAVDAGAREIVVADAHYTSFNLPLDKVHPAARLLYNPGAVGVRFPFLDSSFDAMFLIAYHAKAGTLHAVLEHTMSSESWHCLRVNNRELGEIGIDAALAGKVGVPVTLVTGDDKACAEARGLLGKIETAVVKKGLGRVQALCLPVEETRKKIREAAKRACLNTGKVKPWKIKGPALVSITYKSAAHADSAMKESHEAVRVDGYTVKRRFKDFSDWFGAEKPRR